MTRCIAPLRISSCTPWDVTLVTGPGTPITTRLRPTAQRAELSAPLRRAASTTTVPADRAAMSRLRPRKRERSGALPGGTSDTTSPVAAMWSISGRWAVG